MEGSLDENLRDPSSIAIHFDQPYELEQPDTENKLSQLKSKMQQAKNTQTTMNTIEKFNQNKSAIKTIRENNEPDNSTSVDNTHGTHNSRK